MHRDVIHVETLESTELLLTFQGGERRKVDVAELVKFTGVFAPLRDPGYFRRVRVDPDVGTIVWPNGADLCPDVLYERSKPLTTDVAAQT